MICGGDDDFYLVVYWFNELVVILVLLVIFILLVILMELMDSVIYPSVDLLCFRIRNRMREKICGSYLLYYQLYLQR